MMWLTVTVLLSAAYPLGRAWLANRRTTLRSAMTWAAGAWAVWLISFSALALGDESSAALGRYLGLVLTGCAAVAVLGARRPGVAAWNFVVLGLLAVLLLPLARGLGQARLEVVHVIFLAAILLVGLLNYLGTRLTLAVLLAGLGCGLAFAALVTPAWLDEGSSELLLLAGLSLGLAPWLGLVLITLRPRGGMVDAIW